MKYIYIYINTINNHVSIQNNKKIHLITCATKKVFHFLRHFFVAALNNFIYSNKFLFKIARYICLIWFKNYSKFFNEYVAQYECQKERRVFYDLDERI